MAVLSSLRDKLVWFSSEANLQNDSTGLQNMSQVKTNRMALLSSGQKNWGIVGHSAMANICVINTTQKSNFILSGKYKLAWNIKLPSFFSYLHSCLGEEGSFSILRVPVNIQIS